MNVIPSGDRLLIERDPIAEKTDSGIILNAEKDDKITRTGIIKASGTKVTDEFTVGRRVLFNKYAGICYKDELFLMKQDELLAIIK